MSNNVVSEVMCRSGALKGRQILLAVFRNVGTL